MCYADGTFSNKKHPCLTNAKTMFEKKHPKRFSRISMLSNCPVIFPTRFIRSNFGN